MSLIVQCPIAGGNPLHLTEEDVINRCGWVILVRSTKLPHYLRYPGSRLCPLTQVRFSCVKSVGNSSTLPALYEDLWYHAGQPIGCRRYNTMTLDKFELGTIFVQPSPDTTADTRSLANAIMRLSVELNVLQLDATAVIVPEDMCQQLVSDLGSFGFHQRTTRSGAEASIHVVSNPRVFDEYLYFDK